MITIEEIKKIPAFEYVANSKKEFELFAEITPLWSTDMWLIKAECPLFVCGIYWPNLMVPPEFWILICAGFVEKPVRGIIVARRLLPKLLGRYPRLIARAPVGDERARKLIEVGGFHLVDEVGGFARYEARA